MPCLEKSRIVILGLLCHISGSSVKGLGDIPFRYDVLRWTWLRRAFPDLTSCWGRRNNRAVFGCARA